MNRIVFLTFLLFFVFFQSTSIYGGDSGDLVTAAYTGSIAHPPGYPLYSFLGYLVGHIPLSTVAWRVALLSSVSMAGTLTVLFMLMKSISKAALPSFLGAALVGLTYLYWLYGIVPEVFALNALLTSVLLYLGYHYSQNPSRRVLQLIALVTGLGLAHHQIIVFSLPAIAILVFQQKKHLLNLSIKDKLTLILWGMIGLTPYVWAYIAGVRIAPLVWDDPVTIKNFIRLVTRADYGSFQSGTSFGIDIRSRLLQFPALFDFYLQDFGIFGLLLAITGIIGMFMKARKVFFAIFIGFMFTGPLYFFYASYLYTSTFHIATAERFLTPSYLYIALFLGYGIHAIFQISKPYKRYVQLLTLALPLSLIAMQFLINFPQLSILKYDRTAENFGHDILNTVEKESIIFLQGDHPVFNTQYVYYAEGARQDVHIIHLTKLINGTGLRQIDKYYPELDIPMEGDSLANVLPFIEHNYASYPMYATLPFEIIPVGYRWVPYGLLYRLYKEEDVPDYANVSARNKYVWSMYQHPYDGSLGLHKNLMLSNVTDYYKDASVRRGLYAATHGEDYEAAIEYYNYSLGLDPERGSIHYLKGEAYMSLGECEKAQDLYEAGYSYRTDDEKLYFESMYTLYSECYKNEVEAKIWATKLDELSKDKEVKLQEL